MTTDDQRIPITVTNHKPKRSAGLVAFGIIAPVFAGAIGGVGTLLARHYDMGDAAPILFISILCGAIVLASWIAFAVAAYRLARSFDMLAAERWNSMLRR